MTRPSRSAFPPTRRRLTGPAACALVVALGLLAGLAPTPAGAQSPSADTAGVGTAAPADDQDRIYPGDVVKLVVWREKELTGEFPVDRRGKVVLPLVGEYDVAGRSPEAFKEQVVSDLREEIWNPSIDVRVLRRVRVMGAVTEPGLYTLDPTMSIADALAAARGRNQYADTERVVLYRDGEKVADALDVNSPIYGSPIRSGDELVVPERSWLERHAGAVITGTATILGILLTFAR